jgi:hypothetical protein
VLRQPRALLGSPTIGARVRPFDRDRCFACVALALDNLP